MLTIVQAQSEAEAAEAAKRNGVVAVVHEDDYTGEGEGWNLLVAAKDVIEEIKSRFTARRPLLRQAGTGLTILSVQGSELEVMAVLAS